MATYLTAGITLKKEYYNEFDCQYVIFSDEFGKLPAVAKGGKKPTSKLAPHLETFLVFRLMFAWGVTAARIGAVEILENYSESSKDLTKLAVAGYFLEAVDLLMPYQAKDRQVFRFLVGFFKNLAVSRTPQESLAVLNKFSFYFLSYLGYCPVIKSASQRKLVFELDQLVRMVSDRETKKIKVLAKIFR